MSTPGGPKVIEAIEAELDLAGDPLELTWRSLDQIGNLSSSSVLHVLRDTLDKRSLIPGTPGMLMAMGPGFCSALVLLQWGTPDGVLRFADRRGRRRATRRPRHVPAQPGPGTARWCILDRGN